MAARPSTVDIGVQHVQDNTDANSPIPFPIHEHYQNIISTLGLPTIAALNNNATLLHDDAGRRTPILLLIPSKDTTLVLKNSYHVSWLRVAQAVSIYFHKIGGYIMTTTYNTFFQSGQTPPKWALQTTKAILTLGQVPKLQSAYINIRLYNMATIGEKLLALCGVKPEGKIHLDIAPSLEIIETKDANPNPSPLRGLGTSKRGTDTRPEPDDDNSDQPPKKGAPKVRDVQPTDQSGENAPGESSAVQKSE